MELEHKASSVPLWLDMRGIEVKNQPGLKICVGGVKINNIDQGFGGTQETKSHSYDSGQC